MNYSPYWPDSLAHHLPLPQPSLYENLETSAGRYPRKTALHYYGGALSYAQLRQEVEALAGFLQRQCGIARGDRVALYMQNSPQYVIGYYAILRANAVVVPVNPMNNTAELRHIIEDCGAKVALLGDEPYENARPLLGDAISHVIVARYADYLSDSTNLPLPAVLTEAVPELDVHPEFSVAIAPRAVRWRAALAAAQQPSPYVASPEDLAVIPYTSGTTAAPKGCMHTHRSANHVVAASAQWCGLSQDSVILCSMPMFHVSGMQHTMNLALFLGAAMVVMTRWDSHCAAQLIERYRISYWSAISTMMIDFMSVPDLDRFDLSSIEIVGGGGAAMPRALAQRMAARLAVPYVEGYGLSETIGATHLNPPQRCKQQCLGIPIQDTESIVVDPTTFEVLDPGVTGEILVGGPQVFTGYWGRPEATRDAFVEVAGIRYLRTGDLGYIDEDGYFFFVDRLKRMINVSGYKVWPAEVETLLFGHPAIQDACVVAARDARKGEIVKAFVVLRAGADVSAKQIIEWAHEHMASYKVPQIVEFVLGLPRTGSGKVQWRLLQDRENSSPLLAS
ncbi:MULTISPECIES: long-chain-fatty-acid--CoA ligase [Paraburkholderia]|uniref:Long-chain-fatty-acid--CoA ligase n=1 Tax=Paraburkholderia madseniana TaxID=2599607 RepID=A0AAP5EZQ6_9BURK|nr:MULTISPECIES: long-chain-fatty-acid--CoA ligase [Paraburkholderia]MCX4151397.1 long-chain-fatty-acid--CoA ligase [Paraburkholderia madseniana]MDN7154328.1 long-chain-fatty-acid--CoA ligase [Paraburkholderia sp. WS6]MDQ6413210.1 long-chain-fatty-acid--CoA ligase [Paraburkholderia madseniana]